MRPAAVNGRKGPLTCKDADLRRCWRQKPVAGLCESKCALLSAAADDRKPLHNQVATSLPSLGTAPGLVDTRGLQ